MNLTTEQRQKYGSLLAKQRNLKNDLNQVENELSDFVLQIVGEPFTKTEAKLKYDISMIRTETAEGPNGIYRKATAEANLNNKDFDDLVKDLESHNGKLTKDGVFIWKFSTAQQTTVGFKKSNR